MSLFWIISWRRNNHFYKLEFSNERFVTFGRGFPRPVFAGLFLEWVFPRDRKPPFKGQRARGVQAFEETSTVDVPMSREPRRASTSKDSPLPREETRESSLPIINIIKFKI